MSAVQCPVCSALVPSYWINSHLDGPDCRARSERQNDDDNDEAIVEAASFSRAKGKQKVIEESNKNTNTLAHIKVEDIRGSGKLGQSSAEFGSSLPTSEDQQPMRKKFKSTQALEDAKPLAEKMRPIQLDDLVGQQDLLGEGALLRQLIEQDRVGSCIFWGPPGSGKTTLARVIAGRTSSVFKELSATNASVADLRKVFEDAKNLLLLTGRKTIIFIDEIQRFTKAQQDYLLPVLESGTISLIASTTENPSFRINGALLSRCRVFVLRKLEADDIFKLLVRALRMHALSDPESEPSSPMPVPAGPIDASLLRFLASASDGDARVALSSLELALAATTDTTKPLSRQRLKAQLRKAHLQYDRTGDQHYDTISALHKSIRGSDADASLYWLARMLEGGDDPLYVARRLIRVASEDVGSANPQALPQAVAAYQACQLVGMPECDVMLAQTVVMLAESPKSVRVYQAYNKAKALVKEQEGYTVPMHIRNAPTKLMKELGYGRHYKYEPSYSHPVYQPFWPRELQGTKLLQDDDVIDDRRYDAEALDEWEKQKNDGKRWQGRDELEAKLRRAGRVDEAQPLQDSSKQMNA
ncbi:DNA-dependent ATPase mgs1 [Microbotryomycetes sp. JL221]|nr:DNA-dependent ATPase mgs1 [Microbotryomycetes sp. JL221]